MQRCALGGPSRAVPHGTGSRPCGAQRSQEARRAAGGSRRPKVAVYANGGALLPEPSSAKRGQQRTSWPVTLRISNNVVVPVKLDWHDEGCGLHNYMSLPVDQYVLLELPLGARLERVEDTDILFRLIIPKVQFFWLCVKPTIELTVEVLGEDAPEGPCVKILALWAAVEGEWAEANGLNDRFDFGGKTMFTWGGKNGSPLGDSAITSVTDLIVGVDPPQPFSMLPVGVLESVGTAVVGTLSEKLQGVFVKALARDYTRWATDPIYRLSRDKYTKQASAAASDE